MVTVYNEGVGGETTDMTDLGYTCVAHLLATGVAAALPHTAQPAVALWTDR